MGACLHFASVHTWEWILGTDANRVYPLEGTAGLFFKAVTRFSIPSSRASTHSLLTGACVAIERSREQNL